MDRKTARDSRAARMLSQVDVHGRQSMRSVRRGGLQRRNREARSAKPSDGDRDQTCR